MYGGINMTMNSTIRILIYHWEVIAPINLSSSRCDFLLSEICHSIPELDHRQTQISQISSKEMLPPPVRRSTQLSQYYRTRRIFFQSELSALQRVLLKYIEAAAGI